MNKIFGRVTLGADPEVFIVNKEGVPWGAAQTEVTGTKEKPQPRPYGAIQVDGLALEYNIHPVDNIEDWVRLHKEAMVDVETFAKKIGCRISTASLLHFDKYIETTKPDPEGDELLFGCDPDFNADTLKENVMPDVSEDIKFRTTGGHIHIGIEKWEELHGGDKDIANMMAARIVKALDLLLGVPSVSLDNGFERKKLYGKAGAYRVKPYGVEYRTLSNFWVFDEQSMRAAFETVTGLFEEDVFNLLVGFADEKRDEVVSCINENKKELQVELTKDLVEKFKK